MPDITVIEKCDSRPAAKGDSPSATLKYNIAGTDDEQAALAALAAEAPAFYAALVRLSWRVEPVGDGSDRWDGEVEYGRMSSAAPEVGESSYQFDTGGGTIHITQGLAHILSASAGFWKLCTAPDHGGAIGATPESVEGCDISAPVYTFSETHCIAAATVTAQYKANLFALTASVNAAAFKGFAAGEVLFLGASGSQRGDDNWEITFNYAASPNVEDLCADWPAAAKPTNAVPKKGWEYAWIEYHMTADESAKCIRQFPRAVHVERVYRGGDFSTLP